jgi:hypothetical protein
VFARARPWTIDRLARAGRIVTIDLRGPADTLTLLHPFDRISACPAPGWRRARIGGSAAPALDAAIGGTGLAALDGGRAPLALPSWQLAAACAFEQGTALRVLLADAVGLGKTVQAGLALATLRAAGALDHALVLVPAGLREQWARELEARLGLQSWTADPLSWRAAQARLPPGTSAWCAHPLVLSSIDFVKQPDVLAAAAAVSWDVLVVDEAHNAGPGSDRRAAVHALASGAARLLLVTATPHAGDDEGFESLCTLGARAGETAPLLVRRAREDVGLPRASRCTCCASQARLQSA